MRYKPNLLKIVGFQDARRTLEQQALDIDLNKINSDIKQELFTPIQLKYSATKAKEVFNRFDDYEPTISK